MMALATGWLPQSRSLAVSLVSVGVGVAPMTVSPFAAWLLTTSGWRSAQLVIDLLVWAPLLPAAVLVRQPPGTAAHDDGGKATIAPGRSGRRCARSRSSCSR